MVSVQTTKDKHTTDRLLHGNPYMSFLLFWHSKAVCRLLLQPPALHASVAGRRVVALSCPGLLPATAGGPRGPAAPAAVNGDGCWAEPHIRSSMATCLTFQISQKFKGDDVMRRVQWCGWMVSANLCASESPRRPAHCSRLDTRSHTWCLEGETGWTDEPSLRKIQLVVFFPPRKSSLLFIWMWKRYWVISFASAELCEI